MTLRILYLTHDLSDAMTHKRVKMLQDGGAAVTIAGFSRGGETASHAIHFGQTYNNGFLQRIFSVVRTLITLRRHRALFAQADLILARNLEMLAIAVRGLNFCKHTPALVYECLDIHRLMLRKNAIGTSLRWLEGWLAKRALLLITSSPAFVREYFTPISQVHLPVHLVENKLYPPSTAIPSPRPHAPPWRIGWFGAIRCEKSLHILSQLALHFPGQIEVIIRGKPAYDRFDDFDKTIGETPGMQFLGPYQNPDDLAAIYNDAHFIWAIDLFEEGANSSWLLPNRLYEGCAYATVPITLDGFETGCYIKNLGIGVTLPDIAALTAFFGTLTPESYQILQQDVTNIPVSNWTYSQQDCRELVQFLSGIV